MYPGKGSREIFLIFFYILFAFSFSFPLFYANFVGMNHKLFTIFASLWLLLLSACSESGQFRINGIVDGFGTGNLRLIYLSGGSVRSVTATAVDGKFMALAQADHPTLIRIYTSQGAVIGRLIVEPGQTVDLRINTTDPADMEVEGSKESERLAEFLAKNAKAVRDHDTAALNAAIVKEINDPPDRLLSGALLTDFYDPRGRETEVLKLIAALRPEVVRNLEMPSYRELLAPLTVPLDSISIPLEFKLFSTSDSIEPVRISRAAANLIIIADASQRSADSITSALSTLTPGRSASDLAIISISTDRDTAAWHSAIRQNPGDPSPLISRYWSPAPYSIPALAGAAPASTPWFIVADSTGAVLYRGPSVSRARRFIPPVKKS